MSRASVKIVGGGLDVALGPEPKTVRSSALILAVSGHTGRSIRVDGKETRLSSGPTGLVPLDFGRSTGYHRVEVDREIFWFATEDSKLGLSGIEAMLDELRSIGTGWSGQAMFSDGTGFRDPHVLYGWLDEWADKTILAIETVLAAPRAITTSSRSLSRRGGNVLTVPTVKLLRSAPKRHLTERSGGAIKFGSAFVLWIQPRIAELCTCETDQGEQPSGDSRVRHPNRGQPTQLGQAREHPRPAGGPLRPRLTSSRHLERQLRANSPGEREQCLPFSDEMRAASSSVSRSIHAATASVASPFETCAITSRVAGSSTGELAGRTRLPPMKMSVVISRRSPDLRSPPALGHPRRR